MIETLPSGLVLQIFILYSRQSEDEDRRIKFCSGLSTHRRIREVHSSFRGVRQRLSGDGRLIYRLSRSSWGAWALHIVCWSWTRGPAIYPIRQNLYLKSTLAQPRGTKAFLVRCSNLLSESWKPFQPRYKVRTLRATTYSTQQPERKAPARMELVECITLCFLLLVNH